MADSVSCLQSYPLATFLQNASPIYDRLPVQVQKGITEIITTWDTAKVVDGQSTQNGLSLRGVFVPLADLR